MRFSTFSFVHHSNLPGPLTNGFKYFRFWLRFRRVNYFVKIISPGSQFFYTKTRIALRNLNQAGSSDEKNRGRKSCWTVPFYPLMTKGVHLYPVTLAIFLGWSIRGRMVKFCHQFPLHLCFHWEKQIRAILYRTHFKIFYVYKTLKSTKNLS